MRTETGTNPISQAARPTKTVRPTYRDRDRAPSSGLTGKYGHGLALSPQAEALAEAFLRLSGRDAFRLLLAQYDQGEALEDIEANTLEPALVKVAELWLRGRVEDSRFDELSTLAENVERQLRLVIALPGVARQSDG